MKYLVALCFCFVSLVSFSQTDSTQPPYKRFPTVPPIKILLSDSSTMYTKADIPKNKAVLLMLFSPDCSHCQHETEELIKHKAELKDVQIVMATLQPLSDMKAFVEHYKLTDLPNVVVGKDIYFFMPSFFNIHNLPFLAMYDKKGQLIGAFEGTIAIPAVAKVFEKSKKK